MCRHFPIDETVGTSDIGVMDVDFLIEKAGGRPQLQALLGVARTTILDWEKLGRIPANRVAQISAALDLPVKDVIALASPPRRAVSRDAA